MPRIKMPAVPERIEGALDFLNSILDNVGCTPKARMQLNVAADELLTNVAMYAYTKGKGDVSFSVDILDDPKRAVLTFIDSGIPYDPLKKEDPDITLSAEERKIGGLGIFIVKKTMDDMTYSYENGQNVLTIVKYL